MPNKENAAKIDKYIEVVTADTTGMKETAFGSINASRRVCDVLQDNYTRVNFNVVNSRQELIDIAYRKPDLVVPCVKYILDRGTSVKIWLSDYFDELGVPYTGSTKETLEFDSNKGTAKRAVHDMGLPTAKFFFASPGLIECERKLPLPLPLFVKPMDAANGHGIDENSLVHDFASYETKIQEIYSTYGVPALVEEYLSGREFTVSVLDDPLRNQRMISPVEIIVPKNKHGDRILGHQEKLRNNENLAPVIEPDLATISQLAGKVFSALGVRDFGRIDIKMDAHGNPYFLEANLVPGMTPETSYFPRACYYNQGMSYESVVLKIAEIALFRAEEQIAIPLDVRLRPLRELPHHCLTGPVL